MFPYSQSVTPAVKNHLEAQIAFINDVSKAMFRSYQQMVDLNIQLTQTMLEETTLASNSLLTADRQTEVMGAAASRAQPATEKLRAYHQHISRVAADAQVDLARVTEQHVQETTRTARALADEVARAANEETDRSMRTQQETMRKFTDPFQNAGNGQAQGEMQRETRAAGSSMQSGAQGSQGSMQSGAQGSQGGQPSAGGTHSSQPGAGGTHSSTGSQGSSSPSSQSSATSPGSSQSDMQGNIPVQSGQPKPGGTSASR